MEELSLAPENFRANRCWMLTLRTPVAVHRRSSRRAADLFSQGWSTDEPQRVSAQPLDRIMHNPKPINHHARRPSGKVDQRATVFRGRNQTRVKYRPSCVSPLSRTQRVGGQIRPTGEKTRDSAACTSGTEVSVALLDELANPPLAMLDGADRSFIERTKRKAMPSTNCLGQALS